MSYKIYDFIDLRIRRDILEKLPKTHLNFVAASGLAANDISVFSTLLIGFMHADVKSDLLVHISSIRHLVLRRNLYAKIVEFIKVFDDYAKKLSRSRRSNEVTFSAHLFAKINEWQATQEYEFAKEMRTEATHHYLSENAHANIKSYPQDHNFIFLNHPQPTNCFYPVSEEIAHLSKVDDDPAKGMPMLQMQAWLEKMLPELNDLHFECLELAFSLLGDAKARKKVVYVDDSLLATADTRYPLLYYSGRHTRFR